MFWSSEKIKDRQLVHGLVEPFKPTRISHGAYELSLGPEAFVTSQHDSVTLRLGPDDSVTIPPGQFGILLTEEVVNIPADAVGMISIRARVKFGGLVNVSGFHVDPGFRGRLKFSVYNAGSVTTVLRRGEAVFMLWFCDLDRPTQDLYRGARQGQDSISGEEQTRLQGEVASPGELKRDLDKVQASLDNLRNQFNIVLAVGGSILAAAVVGLFLARPSPPSSATQPAQIEVVVTSTPSPPVAPTATPSAPVSPTIPVVP